MAFTFSVPTSAEPMNFQIEPGDSLYFVGANGGGKTRLAVKIEEEIGEKAHRISAHRALTLNPGVDKISEEKATKELRIGYFASSSPTHRIGHRWKDNPSVNLLNDYDSLVQLLFADQANVSLQTHKDARAGNGKKPAATKFETLERIWNRILPHRTLDITGDDIRVSIPDSTEQCQYTAADMSDGERAIFYLVGQTLAAAADSLIIFDEPELHIHRSIMASLWDELEKARPDCAIVVISHDLEFVASRTGQKYVLRCYDQNKNGTGRWTIEEIPKNADFSEEITTLILGSRKNVLFVEGDEESLDNAIYRACYPDWTILPQGSCEQVKRAVAAMRKNKSLSRLHCAGIIDADGADDEEAASLKKKGVEILPVSEIENLFLLPDVLKEIAKREGYKGPELENKYQEISDKMLSNAKDGKNQRESLIRYCKRRISRELQKIGQGKCNEIKDLETDYLSKTGNLKVIDLYEEAQKSIQDAIHQKNAAKLLKWYDNKGLLAIAADVKRTDKIGFEEWIKRVLRNGTEPALLKAIQKLLPKGEDLLQKPQGDNRALDTDVATQA